MFVFVQFYYMGYDEITNYIRKLTLFLISVQFTGSEGTHFSQDHLRIGRYYIQNLHLRITGYLKVTASEAARSLCLLFVCGQPNVSFVMKVLANLFLSHSSSVSSSTNNQNTFPNILTSQYCVTNSHLFSTISQKHVVACKKVTQKTRGLFFLRLFFVFFLLDKL